MSKRSFFTFIFTVLSFYLWVNTVFAMNSLTITTDTIAAIPHCLHFRVRGICTWVSPISGINTTPYVEEYLPDLVVTVFNKPRDNPWVEMNNTLDVFGEKAESDIVSHYTNIDAGSGQHSLNDEHEQNVFFKEAEVVGNPALSVLPTHNYLPELSLPSTATPFMPYFQSMLDAASWRGFPIPTEMTEEKFAQGADTVSYIGRGLTVWGGLYPHEGKIETNNDAKAAAVIAQRATDLTTTTNPLFFAHVVKKISTRCGQACTATPIEINSKRTQFQRIYPDEQNTCTYFGKRSDYGNNIETKSKGAYVWVVWRFYSGCGDGEGKYIGKTILN
jgi:integrating conjugative element protein (TIGR03756 family)